jgi:hypothetical protein
MEQILDVSLAPAAGSGIGRRLADMLLADPEFITDLKNAFADALKAQVFLFDRPSGKFDAQPDWKTRLAAAVAILANMEGEPVKRIIHQHLGEGGDPAAELDRAIENNPHLIRAMEKQLARAKRRLSEKLVDLPE